MRVASFDNTKSSDPRYLVEHISSSVPSHIQIETLKDTFPNGVIRNGVFYIGSMAGERGESMKIDINPSSRNFMRGQDFNGGTGVGGIVKILMEARGMKLHEIKDMFGSYLNIPQDTTRTNSNPPWLQRPNNQAFQPPEQNVRVKKTIDINTPFTGEWNYINQDGEVICSVRRYDIDGKKEFRPFLPNNTYSKAPEIRPLYNIPNILDNKQVIWVEGEKCAEALIQSGYTATCTLGGAGSLTKNNSHKFDFTPLRGKEVILWPDNDEAGKRLAEIVRDLCIDVQASSVTMLKPPFDKPEKWDAADAVDEQFDIQAFIDSNAQFKTRSINLLDGSLSISRFSGKAPVQNFLIDGTFPLGVPIIFSAAGDAGKGMMTLDLGMKVASGFSMQSAFGGPVKEHGDVIIFTAEDDEAEVHRRIERMDPFEQRNRYEHNLHIVPLPNVGGTFPILSEINGEYVVSEEFNRIYEQILQMSNLKLVVFDPLASFVHADINADPAAGAAFTGLLSRVATETGASILVCHHMTKSGDKAITTPEQARNLIRGTSALVDGVRSAFALWQVDEGEAKKRCSALGIGYVRNICYDGAVVKSNGPAERKIRKFVRDLDSGLLVDNTQAIESVETSNERDVKLNALYNWIAQCEVNGRALCQKTGADSIIERLDDADAPRALHNISQASIDRYVRELIQTRRIAKYSFTATGGSKWLGTTIGSMSNGEYQAVTARDNA